EERSEAPQGVRAGLLAFTPPEGDLGYAAVEVLSERGDLVEAAYRLFSALRRLDRSGVEVIYAERVPEVGLGRAIMDRLRKAANKFEGDWG
ncbi:MAG: L-threonylcarbamoyladenylate synthase type 1 TsaC, partial [Deltaproteobacteria bacterium]